MAVIRLWRATQSVPRMVRYVTDLQKTAGMNPGRPGSERLVTCLGCSEETAAVQFLETQNLWSRLRGSNKTFGTRCWHGYQAFRPGEVTPETAHAIGVRLAGQCWGDRYEVIVATHRNTGSLHNHFLINAVSFRDGKKFHGDFSQSRRIREVSDRLCLEAGLSVWDAETQQRICYTEHQAESEGRPTLGGWLRADIDRAVRASLTGREFVRQMRDLGYTFGGGVRDRTGTVIPALRLYETDGFIPLRRLGRGYGPEDIRERIARNPRREDPFPEALRREAEEVRAREAPEKEGGTLYGDLVRLRFELGFLQRYRMTRPKVPFRILQEMWRLETLDMQIRFLETHGIRTEAELEAFRETQEKTLADLGARRNEARNRQRRRQRAGDRDGTDAARADVCRISGERKGFLAEVRRCRRIAERIPEVRAMLRTLQTPEPERSPSEAIAKEREEEGIEYGQSVRGRGGTGREDRP